jgi:hypothetical protein
VFLRISLRALVQNRILEEEEEEEEHHGDQLLAFPTLLFSLLFGST